MRKIIIHGLFILITGIPSAVFGEAKISELVTGKAKILSGDTLSIAGTPFRLVGIDAPEEKQQCRVASGRTFDCGLVSTTALMDLTVATPVSCHPTGRVRDKLPEARCFAAGYDLSKGMVHTGWALAWPKTGTIYGAIEKTSRKSGNGMWRGAFIAPWEWRKGWRLGVRR